MEENEDIADQPVLDISKHELDREALNQSKLYQHWAHKLADAEYQVSVKKSKLEVLEAELAAKIRIEPKKYIKGDFARGSPSDTAIKAAVIQNPTYQKAKNRYHKAEHLVGQLKANVRACEHRREMIGHMVTMWGKAYWADPYISSEIPRSEWAKLEEEAIKKRVKEFNQKQAAKKKGKSE